MNAFEKNSITVSRHAAPIVITGPHMKFVCWRESDGSLFIVSKDPLLHFGRLLKVNEFVIKLQALNIILLDQFHRCLHF